MATLFGHTKGTFTGAISKRPGLLKTADKGLLFLDEIGELGLDEQAMLLHAIEEKSFLPVGADKPATSDFKLICGSNRNLGVECAKGGFRDDLLARINLWTFDIPGLRDRLEDIEPNFDYELTRFSSRTGNRVTINKEAREMFLNFAVSPQAVWKANFRDLGGAVTRMATLAPERRITIAEVKEETARLQCSWNEEVEVKDGNQILYEILGNEKVNQLDLFDRGALKNVLNICRSSSSLAQAGRHLYNVSREKKRSVNDSDRLRKYLARFEVEWNEL